MISDLLLDELRDVVGSDDNELAMVVVVVAVVVVAVTVALVDADACVTSP